jgi:putative peptidoglycan lipid II flippase
VILNLSVIAAALFLAPHVDPPILALAWGVAIGGVLQLVIQLRPLAKLGMLPKPAFGFRDEGVGRVVRAMGPALLGVSAAQISALINTQLAAWLGDGRISWITYADRLMEFPSALLGVAIGTVLLPSLAKHHSDADHARYSDLMDWGLRLALLLALPAALALWLVAVPLISTLYQYGRFTVTDVWEVRAALLGYAVGLAALILVKILAPGFYARQNVKTPVRIGILTLIATQAMNFAFIGPLGHAGLALAIGLGACLNAWLLFLILRKDKVYLPQPGWLAFALKVAAAVSAMAAVLYFTMGDAAWWLAGTWERKVPAVTGLVLLGFAVYAASLLALGFRPRDFSRRGAG